MKFFLRLALVFWLLATGGVASAQSVSDDVRCFLVSNLFATAGSDAKAQAAANGAAHYYLGRLDRLTIPQLQQAFIAERKAITPANAAGTMNACVERMNKRGRAVQAMGQQLGQSARK